jgi:hypothetical protein
MKRIHWKSKLTGKSGYGQWLDFDPSPTVDYMNRKYPELAHWIESTQGLENGLLERVHRDRVC